MLAKALLDILVNRAGAEREGQVATIQSAAEVALIIGIGEGAVTVSRVTKVELESDGIIVVTGAKNVVHVFLADDVRGVRIGSTERARAGY